MTKHTFFHAGRIAAEISDDTVVNLSDRQARRLNKRIRRLGGVALQTCDRTLVADILVVQP